MRLLRDVEPATLRVPEIDAIRAAADRLLLCDRLQDSAARMASVEVETLARVLVDNRRWTAERAQRIIEDVRACGPAGSIAQTGAA